jgi:hypothetical protein
MSGCRPAFGVTVYTRTVQVLYIELMNRNVQVQYQCFYFTE